MSTVEQLIKEINECEAKKETLHASLMEAQMESDKALRDERVCKAADAIYDNAVEMDSLANAYAELLVKEYTTPEGTI